MRDIEKLQTFVQSIINQIILYRIVSNQIKFLDPFLRQKSLKQQIRFYVNAKKHYLKNPINEVKQYNYPKLLIPKSSQWKKHPKIIKIFTKKVDKYFRTVKNNSYPILSDFPNPFTS